MRSAGSGERRLINASLCLTAHERAVGNTISGLLSSPLLSSLLLLNHCPADQPLVYSAMKNIYIKIPRKKVEDTILRKVVRLEANFNLVTKPFKIDEFCNLHITNNIV